MINASQSNSGKAWNLKYSRAGGETLWTALMKARDIKDPGTFFGGIEISDLHDPFLFPDMNKAVERVLRAAQSRERIVIYGDYDVDGISGAALLVHTLRLLGAEVSYRIPHRKNDGYGLHAKFVEGLAALKTGVLVTVDLGISCFKEVALANELGMDVIITDHHTVPVNIPQAYAILHPLLAPNYPFNHLSGSGVAFKLASALLIRSNREDFIPFLTDLASLGTVADCVPLLGENRALVKLGLKQLESTRWDGLRALLKLAGVESDFSTHTIGFQIGPRLNASGRMDDPLWALQTLLAEGAAATEKAAKLDELNKERQALTIEIEEEAAAVLDMAAPILVAAGKWSSGLVGLVAGRLQEKYQKPVFILEDRGDILVGSARSLPGFHCTNALTELSQHLDHFGGHEQAAGFQMKKENYPAFRTGLLELAGRLLAQNPLVPTQNIDTDLHPEDLTLEIIEKISAFAPFGIGNPKPLFLMENVLITQTKRMGAAGQHLRWSGLFHSEPIEGVAFRFDGDESQLLESTSLAVRLERNDWNGQSTVQLHLVDFSFRHS